MSDSENEEYLNEPIDDEEEEIEEVSNKIEIKNKQVKDENIDNIENNNIKKGNKEKENEKENNLIKNLNKNNSNDNNEFGIEKVNENNQEIEHIETYPDDIDPNVKQLIDLDFTKEDKNKIAELLLNDNLLSIKKQEENNSNPNQNNNNTNIINNKIPTIKKNNKYKNISSTVRTYITGPTNKRNYHYYDYLNNPELTSDFKSATIK